jgi:hypothetical protein
MHGGVAVMAVASIVVVAGCSSPPPPTLRSGDVQDQIAAGLTEQVGGDFTVVCPTGVVAQTGTTFTCSVTDEADGTTITVTVTESDDAGGFDWRVQAPSASGTPSASPS